MRAWSLALLVGFGFASGGLLPSSQDAIAETIAANTLGDSDQCLHPQKGLTPCEVSLNTTTARLNIVWPDGDSTTLSIGNDTTHVQYRSDTEWQAAQYVGLCYEEQCFQAKATELNVLDRGNEKVAAQCFDPMNGTSACYVQSSADARTLTVTLLNGSQFSMTDQGRQSLGVCADNICAFKVQSQRASRDQLARKWNPFH